MRDFWDAVGRKSKPDQQINGNFRRNRKMQKDPSKAPVRWGSCGICQTQLTSGKNRMSLPLSSCRKGDFLRFCRPSHLYLITAFFASFICFILLRLNLLFDSYPPPPSLTSWHSPSRGSEAICCLLIWAVLSVLSTGGGETIMVLWECVGSRPLGRGQRENSFGVRTGFH